MAVSEPATVDDATTRPPSLAPLDESPEATLAASPLHEDDVKPERDVKDDGRDDATESQAEKAEAVETKHRW